MRPQCRRRDRARARATRAIAAVLRPARASRPPGRAARLVLAFALAFAFGSAAAQPAPRATDSQVLRVVFPVAESGFDPQAVIDEYSANLCRAIFDPLYNYDYFARPVKLVPNTAAALPQITDGGRTYTIRVGRASSFLRIPRSAASRAS